MPTGRGYPTAGYSAAAQQYRSATPLLDAIAEPTIKGVRDGLTYVTSIKTRSGVMQIAEPFSVPLDAPRYESVERSATTATARSALARSAARLIPFAEALMMGMDIGQWAAENLYKGLFDQLTSDPWRDQKDQYFAQIPESIGLPQLAGWTFTSCGGIAYGEYILHNDYGYACGASEIQIAGTPPPQANVRFTEGGTAEYAVGWKNNGYIGPGPNQTSFIPAWIGVRNGGTTSPTYAQLAQTVTPARTFMVGPQSDQRIPFDAIPKQDAWSNPLTERGPRPVRPLPQEAFASEAGRTYWVEVSPDGRMDGGSNVPPTETYSQPPGLDEKERKVTLGKGGAPGRIFGTITEIGDFVDCLFSAIPFKQRLKDGVTKRLPKNAQKLSSNPKFQDVGLVKKAQYIVAKFDTIDIAKAINCLVVNEIQDRAIGTANQMANNITKNPYWVSSRGTGMIAPKI